jgi:hypothetical protein
MPSFFDYNILVFSYLSGTYSLQVKGKQYIYPSPLRTGSAVGIFLHFLLTNEERNASRYLDKNA